MQLNELFKKDDINLDIVSDGKSWQASAMLSDSSFFEISVLDTSDYHEVDFTINDDHELTGAGIEFEVLANVTEALRRFKDEHNPSHIAMTASSDKRCKLYTKMFNRLLPGWSVYAVKTRSGLWLMDAIKGDAVIIEDGNETLVVSSVAPGFISKKRYDEMIISANHALQNLPDAYRAYAAELIKIYKDLTADVDPENISILNPELSQFVKQNGI